MICGSNRMPGRSPAPHMMSPLITLKTFQIITRYCYYSKTYTTAVNTNRNAPENVTFPFQWSFVSCLWARNISRHTAALHPCCSGLCHSRLLSTGTCSSANRTDISFSNILLLKSHFIWLQYWCQQLPWAFAYNCLWDVKHYTYTLWCRDVSVSR